MPVFKSYIGLSWGLLTLIPDIFFYVEGIHNKTHLVSTHSFLLHNGNYSANKSVGKTKQELHH